jgi:hypothetical protein
MPTIALPIRYRSPYAIPNVLTPPDDVLPGFNPDFAQAQNLDTASNASPPPADIPPPPANASAAMDTTSVKLPSLTPGGGIRKFKAPTMPPPETVGTVDRQPATDTASNPVQVAPPADASAAPNTGIEKANQTLDAVHAQRPAAPTSNVMQRLGLAVLSTTKMRDAANMLIHPKWSQQQAAYENMLADAEAQQKEAVEAERGEAYSAQKEAQAESYGLNKEARRAATDERKYAAQQRVHDALIKSGAVQMNPGDSVPQGWARLTDPSDPTAVWAKRSPIINLPDNANILAKFPGSKAGDPVAAPEMDGALKAIWNEQLEKTKADNKPEKGLVTPDQRAAAIAIGADPDNPDAWSAQQAGTILDRIRPPREPREPSPTQQRYQEQQTIRQLTNRVVSDAKAGGSQDDSLYDDAMRNVRNFYQNDPEIDAYREDVISRLQSLKRGGLNTDVVQNRVSSAAGKTDWMKRLQGGTANQPAKPPSAASRLGQQIAKRVRGQGVSGQTKPPIVQANSLQEVIAKAPAGTHLLRNGSTLEKRPDGRVLLDGKVVQ